MQKPANQDWPSPGVFVLWDGDRLVTRENYSFRVLTDWIELLAGPYLSQLRIKCQIRILGPQNINFLQPSNFVRLQWKGWQEPLNISVWEPHLNENCSHRCGYWLMIDITGQDGWMATFPVLIWPGPGRTHQYWKWHEEKDNIIITTQLTQLPSQSYQWSTLSNAIKGIFGDGGESRRGV